MREYVADTGPLISFERIPDGFLLLRRLVKGIVVPPEVVEELAAGSVPTANYLMQHGIADLVCVEHAPPCPAAAAGLHAGEAAAIALALAKKLPLLIEERQGRQVAAALGVETTGSVGLLLYACNTRIITKDDAEGYAQALLQGKRINRKLFEALVRQFRPS
jgi:predicted nucleic acid-binding protein